MFLPRLHLQIVYNIACILSVTASNVRPTWGGLCRASGQDALGSQGSGRGFEPAGGVPPQFLSDSGAETSLDPAFHTEPPDWPSTLQKVCQDTRMKSLTTANVCALHKDSVSHNSTHWRGLGLQYYLPGEPTRRTTPNNLSDRSESKKSPKSPMAEQSTDKVFSMPYRREFMSPFSESVCPQWRGIKCDQANVSTAAPLPDGPTLKSNKNSIQVNSISFVWHLLQ